MDSFDSFEIWLDQNTDFTTRTKSNIKSRIRRADQILPFQQTDVYVFHLSNEMKKKNLSVSVRSQIKKSISLYLEFLNGVTK